MKVWSNLQITWKIYLTSTEVFEHFHPHAFVCSPWDVFKVHMYSNIFTIIVHRKHTSLVKQSSGVIIHSSIPLKFWPLNKSTLWKMSHHKLSSTYTYSVELIFKLCLSCAVQYIGVKFSGFLNTLPFLWSLEILQPNFNHQEIYYDYGHLYIGNLRIRSHILIKFMVWHILPK